jgi:putative ABC transport system substrate-binding protein
MIAFSAMVTARREFVSFLGAMGLWSALPRSVRGQALSRIHRIGFFMPLGRETPAVAATFDELRENGFVEGKNLEVVSGSFNVGINKIADIAPIIVKAAPDAICCGPELYIRELQKLTRNVPLLAMTEDMVGEGLVSSLARPGGNTTGLSILSPELDGKRQELLIEAVPGVRKIAALANAETIKQQHRLTLQAAAHARGVELDVVEITRAGGVFQAIEVAHRAGAQALNFLAGSLVPPDYDTVFERVSSLQLPAIHQWPEAAEAGCLLGYGPSFTRMFQQRAYLLVKVLRGAKPADQPVEQPTRFELVVNLRTAKAAGYEVPAGLVLRADKVIE